MPNIAEVEPRMTSNGAVRTRGRRDDLRSILEHLAYNLRWSWNPATIELFRTLGPDPWQRSHNPISVLRTVDAERLARFVASQRGAQFTPDGTLKFSQKATGAAEVLVLLKDLLETLATQATAP